ncbi:MAG: septum site-determining protein MinC [Clostridia bacterium]|nr:septum site-determining protein MinC [Clostridia bacterium]MBQ3461876.1 septum site-determining protein MinC [Clostridia bacterium]MBQ3470793.1 septum site-determining protein MinC [Clostridia bacterium]MBQ6529610.1 septum site-determining protein MinC [Clostridia bacterium]MBQ6558929.1 septum site-determining protein MinC [Clostridia bacterium]
MEKEIIKLKGTGDGVKIYLDKESSISDITSSLYEKLRQFRKFFGDGHCNIYFIGRELTPSDKMRLEAIAGAMLPESSVNYGEQRRVRENNDLEKTLELPEEIGETAAIGQSDEMPFREIKDVVTTNFKSSRARFYEGTVRGGKKVESDGHLILVGDVLEDGAVSAVGNIVIMGALKGKAHAGCMGSDSAYVIALNMSPTDIRISNAHAYYDVESFRGGAKKAYLSDDKIVAEDFNV